MFECNFILAEFIKNLWEVLVCNLGDVLVLCCPMFSNVNHHVRLDKERHYINMIGESCDFITVQLGELGTKRSN